MKNISMLLCIILLVVSSCSDNSGSDLSKKLERTINREVKKVTKKAAKSSKAIIKAPQKASALPIPEGFKIVEYEKGQDLIFAHLFEDSDRMDAVGLIIKQSDPNEIQLDDEVYLVFWNATEDGKWSEYGRSGDLTGQSVFYDAVQHLYQKGRVITYHHQFMRSDFDIKLRYERKYRDVVVIGLEYNSYGNAVHDYSGNTSVNYLIGKQIKVVNKYDEAQDRLIDGKEEVTRFDPDPPFRLRELNGDNLWGKVESL